MQNKYINASFFYLRALPDALADLFKKHNESISKIRRKARLEPNASQYDVTRAEREKSGELTAAKDAALKELSEMRTAAATKQEIADRHLERELCGLVPAPNMTAALLSETRQQSAWMRIKPLLDRQTDIEPLKGEIQSLVKGFIQPVDDSPGAFDSSDLDSIIALKKELPFYVKGRFAPMEADLYVEQSIDALEAALADLRAEYAEAVSMKKELKTGMIQINTAFNYAQAAIENNETETIIPVWLKGETIMLR